MKGTRTTTPKETVKTASERSEARIENSPRIAKAEERLHKKLRAIVDSELVEGGLDVKNDAQIIAALRSDANPDAVDVCGRTALHNVVLSWPNSEERNNALEALMRTGADDMAKDHFGKTPFDLAKEKIPPDPKLVALLEAYSHLPASEDVRALIRDKLGGT